MRATNFANGAEKYGGATVDKGVRRNYFSRMTLVVRTATLYNTRELARATRQATLEDNG